MSYADDKLKQGSFQQYRGCNSMVDDLIWPVYKLIWDFIHVYLIGKFQEKPIKTEQVTLMTMSNRKVFSNQGEVTLKLMIQSGQVSISSENTSMSILSASFRNVLSKLNDDLYKLLAFYQILYHITLCDVYMWT